MLFTDEKLFTVATLVNLQNNRLYVGVPREKKQSCGYQLLRTRSHLSKSVMVSVGISSLGCTQVIFVDPVVKISSEYYRDVLLGEHLLPAIKALSGVEFFIFQ